jgi:hypothetical protein
MGLRKSDQNKRLITLTVIILSGILWILRQNQLFKGGNGNDVDADFI